MYHESIADSNGVQRMLIVYSGSPSLVQRVVTIKVYKV
jgi:hypothetical protein